MANALFRAEVLSAPSLNWGSTRLRAPMPWPWVTGLCALIIAAGIPMMCTLDYVNKAKVSGFLAPAKAWSTSGLPVAVLFASFT